MKTSTFAMLLFPLVALMASGPPARAQAAAISQPPAISEEARKCFLMGMTLFREAGRREDYSPAIIKLKQAVDLAPQWPEARYNLAAAREAAGDYAGAMADLKLYQQFKLAVDEARRIQDKIYVLDARREKAARGKEPHHPSHEGLFAL